MSKPITEKVKGLRQRQRKDRTWRVWWEPKDYERDLGFEPLDLDADRPTWSIRQAKQQNRAIAAAAEGGLRDKKAGGRTVQALIARYKAEPRFAALAVATQVDYTEMLGVLEEKWGPQPVAAFSKPVMREYYETQYRTRGATRARQLVRMMSALFSYAELIGWRPVNTNPCFRLKMTNPKPRSRVATWAEFDTLLDASDALSLPGMKLAIQMGLLTGQRQTTIIRAHCNDFFEGELGLAWSFVRSKRGNAGVLPLHEELAPIVSDRLDTASDLSAPLIIDGKTGDAYDTWGFQRDWKKVRARAAETVATVGTLMFRDLRRTFSVMARQGGATKDDAADVLGNTANIDPELSETYMLPIPHTAIRAVQSIRRPGKRA